MEQTTFESGSQSSTVDLTTSSTSTDSAAKQTLLTPSKGLSTAAVVVPTLHQPLHTWATPSSGYAARDRERGEIDR